MAKSLCENPVHIKWLRINPLQKIAVGCPPARGEKSLTRHAVNPSLGGSVATSLLLTVLSVTSPLLLATVIWIYAHLFSTAYAPRNCL